LADPRTSGEEKNSYPPPVMARNDVRAAIKSLLKILQSVHDTLWYDVNQHNKTPRTEYV